MLYANLVTLQICNSTTHAAASVIFLASRHRHDGQRLSLPCARQDRARHRGVWCCVETHQQGRSRPSAMKNSTRCELASLFPVSAYETN